ncbi:hypothetical protein BJ508DRAFT_419204 [Ascobolus immersus RN42]|uniref:Uncharacterized protein n=1 Tax=Ascobolus immersus RN42 TaxID=1160509 RepID=A0A3N4HFZ8_ASCIM|nr:hypothetical protein BJ508DRAFT_419204 [Ascobolus immersus RN42]
MYRTATLPPSEKCQIKTAYCKLTNILTNDTPFLELLNTPTSTAQDIQTYLLSKISPLVRYPDPYNGLFSHLVDPAIPPVYHVNKALLEKLKVTRRPDCVQRLMSHVSTGGVCAECFERSDLETLRTGLGKYEEKRVVMMGGEKYLEELEKNRQQGMERRELQRRAEQERKEWQRREEERQKLERERKWEEDRRVFRLKWQQAEQWADNVYCVMTEAAIKNPDFLALFEGPLDRTPTVLANIILEMEFRKFVDKCDMNEELRGHFDAIMKDRHGSAPLDHFRFVRLHLSSDSRMKQPPSRGCPTLRCPWYKHPEVLELKQRLLVLDQAIKVRLEQEAVAAGFLLVQKRAEMEEERIRREIERLRLARKWQVETRRLQRKTDKRRCYSAKVLSVHSTFMELLRGDRSWTWIDEVGKIVAVVHTDFAKETKDTESHFPGKSWRPGYTLAEELLWHLFGKSRGGNDPCMECPMVPSVQEMKELLRKALELDFPVDLHFQRPLDSWERQNVIPMRLWCYEKVASTISTEAREILSNSQDGGSSPQNFKDSIEKLGSKLREELEKAQSKGRIKVQDPRTDRRLSGKVRETKALLDCTGLKTLWDHSAPARVYLEDFERYNWGNHYSVLGQVLRDLLEKSRSGQEMMLDSHVASTGLCVEAVEPVDGRSSAANGPDGPDAHDSGSDVGNLEDRAGRHGNGAEEAANDNDDETQNEADANTGDKRKRDCSADLDLEMEESEKKIRITGTM